MLLDLLLVFKLSFTEFVCFDIEPYFGEQPLNIIKLKNIRVLQLWSNSQSIIWPFFNPMDHINNLLQFCLNRTKKEPWSSLNIVLNHRIYFHNNCRCNVTLIFYSDQFFSISMATIRTFVGSMIQIDM